MSSYNIGGNTHNGSNQGTVTPTPLTATVHNVPQSHGGNAFWFELRFSEDVDLGFATLRDEAMTVSGGLVTNARRVTKGSNTAWEIRINPISASSTVNVVLPATTDCAAQGAVCTVGGKKLSTNLDFTVPSSSG